MSNENIPKDIHEDILSDEQITKVPDVKLMKITDAKKKDPKKVAAGRKLAEYNKKAKEALAREMKRDADSEETKTSEGESWLPGLSFSTVLTLFGIGVTAADLFFRFYRSKTEKDTSDLTPVYHVSPESVPQQKSSAQPRIGMI